MAANILSRGFRKRTAKQRTLLELAAMKQMAELREEQMLSAKFGQVNSAMNIGAKAYGLADRFVPALFGKKGDYGEGTRHEGDIPSTGGLESAAAWKPEPSLTDEQREQQEQQARYDRAVRGTSAPSAGAQQYDSPIVPNTRAPRGLHDMPMDEGLQGRQMEQALAPSDADRNAYDLAEARRGVAMASQGYHGGSTDPALQYPPTPQPRPAPPELPRQIQPTQQQQQQAEPAWEDHPAGSYGELYGTKAEFLSAIKDAAERGDRARVLLLQRASMQSQLRDVGPTSISDMLSGAHIDKARADISAAGKIDPMYETDRALKGAHTRQYDASADNSTESANDKRTFRPALKRDKTATAGIAETEEKRRNELLSADIRQKLGRARDDNSAARDRDMTQRHRLQKMRDDNYNEALATGEAAGTRPSNYRLDNNGNPVRVSPQEQRAYWEKTGKLYDPQRVGEGDKPMPGSVPGGSQKGAAGRAVQGRAELTQNRTDTRNNKTLEASETRARIAAAAKKVKEKEAAANKEKDLGVERAKVESTLQSIAGRHPIPSNNTRRSEMEKREMAVEIKAAIAPLVGKNETPENISRIIRKATGENYTVSRNANQDIVLTPKGN